MKNFAITYWVLGIALGQFAFADLSACYDKCSHQGQESIKQCDKFTEPNDRIECMKKKATEVTACLKACDKPAETPFWIQ